ncbi:MAG: glycosyltransferase family 4 protein [Gemmatimonadaceae bacterium]|nr:glycosyltransferase family 4 protein [Gemmatimonadaceae bacterium]
MRRALSVMLLTTADHWRGSGISYAKIARGLLERGHRVSLIVSSDALAAQYSELGIAAQQLALRHTGVREVFALHAAARENDTDVVIVDKPRDVRLAAWVGLMRPMRTVIRYNRVGGQRRARFVDRWTASRASAALYQSEYIRTKALGELPLLRKLESFVIPNGYDAGAMGSTTAPREQWRASHRIAPGEFVVVSAGFAEAAKRFDLSVDALALLGDRGISATLVFCGDGPCRAELEERARMGRVKTLCLGVQSPADTLSTIAAADVLAHPSPVEIFGNVLAEAMALGTPIIAMRSGGNPEMLGDDCTSSILLSQGTPETFATAIAELHASPERRRALATAARERIATVFPLSLMIDRYDAMLQEIVGERTVAS